MPTSIIDLSGYNIANEVLGQLLEEAQDFRNTLPASADPNSDFEQVTAQMNRINGLIGQLAVLVLEQIDEAVGESGLVQEIDDLSAQAKHEADHLKQVVKTIDGIAKAIDTVAGVVTKIAGLPFL